jgi:hypothetical protein
MESNQDTRSQASYISVAASLTAKLRCCFRGDTTIITGVTTLEAPSMVTRKVQVTRKVTPTKTSQSPLR